ncbi:class I SAM-dependent RNA methyltransferase [Corynebacterium sp. zg-331]|uniref:class I SAM-dependent RNA methyltransferase n=1 Tax=unclassified Corynebacterium TaxID=2624378 RepID=UPI00128C326D|nr:MULTISPECIES: TRAM domain-containing protein [unclassified Corynebacterium]MBC3185425.1 class I SAM-dependent RNA methyltransferase [Corynebacterium sp. zg-331]MPV51920.1 TRAM domain-containing protein [Corynebacterium sp. zg331]
MTDKQETVRVRIDRMAHGGEGIGTLDGRIVFASGAFPGDTVDVRVTKAKHSFLRGRTERLLEASPLRGASRCEAAERGAGCCDFAALTPEAEIQIKETVLRDQLFRIGGIRSERVATTPLEPATQWRTRTRLGVDDRGRAGVRRLASHDLITEVACAQPVAGLLDGLVGDGARELSPGAEVVAVMGDDGQRHVVETRRAARGRRTERLGKTIEGDPEVSHTVAGHTFRFPVTAFWQAHRRAPEAYSERLIQWLTQALGGPSDSPAVAWDLYGGVGLFVPPLAAALGSQTRIYSVDASHAATTRPQDCLEPYDVVVRGSRVERCLSTLPAPRAVVLDPPRTGAGAEVVRGIAQAGPKAVVHIGCDPATFARDLRAWRDNGYRVEKLELINAFPGTHHSEALALIVPGE